MQANERTNECLFSFWCAFFTSKQERCFRWKEMHGQRMVKYN